METSEIPLDISDYYLEMSEIHLDNLNIIWKRLKSLWTFLNIICKHLKSIWKIWISFGNIWNRFENFWIQLKKGVDRSTNRPGQPKEIWKTTNEVMSRNEKIGHIQSIPTDWYNKVKIFLRYGLIVVTNSVRLFMFKCKWFDQFFMGGWGLNLIKRRINRLGVPLQSRMSISNNRKCEFLVPDRIC